MEIGDLDKGKNVAGDTTFVTHFQVSGEKGLGSQSSNSFQNKIKFSSWMSNSYNQLKFLLEILY